MKPISKTGEPLQQIFFSPHNQNEYWYKFAYKHRRRDFADPNEELNLPKPIKDSGIITRKILMPPKKQLNANRKVNKGHWVVECERSRERWCGVPKFSIVIQWLLLSIVAHSMSEHKNKWDFPKFQSLKKPSKNWTTWAQRAMSFGTVRVFPSFSFCLFIFVSRAYKKQISIQETLTVRIRIANVKSERYLGKCALRLRGVS